MSHYRSPRTRGLRIITLLCCMAFAACSDKQQPVEPPAPPTPTPDPLSRTIGPAGGTLVSADSAFSLTVPAGALAAPTAMTVRVVADSAPYGVGKVYELSPAGVRFAKPVSISIAVDSAVVGGVSVPLEGLVVALGDTVGNWTGILDSELNPAPTLSVRGTALSASGSGHATISATVNPDDDDDLAPLPKAKPRKFTKISYWYVDPKSARVRVTESLNLRVLVCSREVEVDGSRFARITRVVPPSAPPVDCSPSTRTGTWFVNGVRGGNSTLGFVATRGNGAPSSVAEFYAPQTVPTPGTVTVRADMYWPARQVTRQFSIPVTIYNDWRGTTSWRSSGGFRRTYPNGSLTYDYIAQGSARFSSFGVDITADGGAVPATDVTATYAERRVDTSRSIDGECSIDVVDISETRGGLNGRPPAGFVSELWHFAISVPSENTYVLSGGAGLLPATTTTTVTTTRACPGRPAETTTKADTLPDYARAASIFPALEVRSFRPGDKRFEGRIDKVDDEGGYAVTSFFKWDITRP